MYNAWAAIKEAGRRRFISENEFCGKNFLNRATLESIQEVKGDLLELVADLGFTDT